MVVEGDRIAALGHYADLADRLPGGLTVSHFPERLIVPGFIDIHTHYPQTDMIASHGAQLMDWLHTHTFPAEAAFESVDHARETAAFFLDELLRNGHDHGAGVCIGARRLGGGAVRSGPLNAACD